MLVKIKVNDRDTVTYLRKVESFLTDDIVKGVKEASEKLTYFVKGNYLNRKGANSIDRVSGEIFRSTIPIKAKKDGDRVVGGTRIGTSAKAQKYVHIHVSPRPKTTIIFPKKAKMLAIPLSAATATFGVRRTSPRDLPSAEFRGNVLGSNISGGFVPFFVMRGSVTIKSRVHTRKIAREYEPTITKVIDKHIARGLKE